MINRSVAVITELLNTLDMSEGQVAQYLDGLYKHEILQLSLANVENDFTKIDEVNTVFKGLLHAWRESTNVA